MDKNKKFEIVRMFRDINRTLHRNMRNAFCQEGLTMPQGMVIGTLMKYGEMKITELSNKLNLSKSTLSGIIDRLEKQQLVIRTRSTEDRRIVKVRVSPKFEQINKEFHKQAENNFAGILASGTPEEIDIIFDGLITLKKILADLNK